MKNPFRDFAETAGGTTEDPIGVLARSRQDLIDKLTDGYRDLIREELPNLIWPVEHRRVIGVYRKALDQMKANRFTNAEVQAFCLEFMGSLGAGFPVPGPVGLYISALINSCIDTTLTLRTQDFPVPFHFLGYALPEGKSLVLLGDAGDFTGAALQGGILAVHGCTGHFCGAGMSSGLIRVIKQAGRGTGVWMQGGEIRLEGSVAEVAEERYGGAVYLKGALAEKSS